MKTAKTCQNVILEQPDTYREPGYLTRLAGMARGLRQPRHSRAYKAAVIEMERISAPVTALLMPLFIATLLSIMSTNEIEDEQYDGVTIREPDEFDTEWKEIDETMPTRPTSELDFTPDLPAVNPDIAVEAPTETRVEKPPVQTLNAVSPVKSIVFVKSIFGDFRSVEARQVLRARYDGSEVTEEAVLRALRWLKKNQQPDGSWKTQRIAMTGLAVLTFLAHGEKPGDSPEFGATVQSALEFLVGSQRPDGRFSGMDGNEYAHPIATYALCEAYGMTLNPSVKAAAEKALVPILRGQHPTGGWTYKMRGAPDSESGAYRDDTSYMGWCVQALKAAKLADLQSDGLEKAIKLAVRGFRKNANPDGGFGYVSPGASGLTGVGTLCMQLLGASAEAEVRRSLEVMDDWRPSFDDQGPMGASPQYYFYYATQAKFHAGGKRWENWNAAMKRIYVKAQQIERNAIKDDRGHDCDIGWWTNGDKHTDRPVMDTCLAALQLMVYYRYLPTTTQAATRRSGVKVLATATDTGDIVVDSGNL